jgi:hypothetical protein
MNLDDLLTEALHDERWALPVPADTLSSVRRLRRARRRRAVLLSTAASVAVLTGVAVAVAEVPGSSTDRVATYASSAAVAPMISPAWTPTSGREWLLTNQEYDAFYASHTKAPYPSPGPGQGRVPSPAPLTDRSAALLADVLAGGLPTGTTYRREDSPGGDPNETAVHVTLADGTPVEVSRRSLDGPFAFHRDGGDGVNAGATEEAVPGTDDAAALYPDFGYGFAHYAGDRAHGVNVVTASGVVTSWAAPSVVPLATLRTWAFAAAVHQG